MSIYTDIDEMPILNWFKYIETGDASWCMKKKPKSITKEQAAKCSESFTAMYDQFLDEFGVPEKMKEVIDMQIQIKMLEIDLAITGARHLNTLIKAKRNMLDVLLKEKSESRTSIMAIIEKRMGFQIDEHNTSVKKYYGYLELLKNG